MVSRIEKAKRRYAAANLMPGFWGDKQLFMEAGFSEAAATFYEKAPKDIRYLLLCAELLSDMWEAIGVGASPDAINRLHRRYLELTGSTT